MYITILLFPLLSAFFSGFFGQYMGSRGVSFFSTFCVFCSFIISCFFFFEVLLYGKTSHFVLFTWLKSGLVWVNWGFQLDSLTAIMLLVVCSVSTLVHLYSTSYISLDPHLSRFIAYLSLFTFFILILITADNFVQIFVGWEGVGLCSYLLINFWFTRIQANKAAIKAMLVNRVGDFGLCLGLFAVFIEFGSFDYATVFSLAPIVFKKQFLFFGSAYDGLTIITMLLFVGSVGKSAQLGLHTWLPDAIEGPTPVSALIHAATIVTAGVFLLVRCSPLFEYAPITLKVVTVFGAITAFFAATTGLVQNDLKKVIAYSTCSQLGYIVFACGLSCYNVGLFHLANHAFFKALLFLTAGSVIHAINDEQDIRKIGGLVTLLPYSYAMIFIGSLALIGFPFLSGFYSKDIILEIAYGSYSLTGHFAFNLGTFAAFFTAFYSIRLLHLTFLSKPRGFKRTYETSHEGDSALTFPLLILSVGSLFFGYIIKDIVVGYGSPFFNHAVFLHPTNIFISDAEFLPLIVKLTPLVFSLTGFTISFILYSFYNKIMFNMKMIPYGQTFYVYLNRKWFFDKVYTEICAQIYIQQSYNLTYKLIDKGALEVFGPYGLSIVAYSFANRIVKLQSGSVYHYIFFILMSLFLFSSAFFFGYYSVGLSDTRLLLLFIFFIVL